MPNPENLNKSRLDIIDKDIARKIQQKGQKASVEKKKAKKARLQTMQEIFEVLLKKKPTDEVIKKIKDKFPELNDEDINTFFILNNNFIEKFSTDLANEKINITDYMKVLEFVRDNIGQKPVERTENLNKTEISLNNKDVAEFTKQLRNELRK